MPRRLLTSRPKGSAASWSLPSCPPWHGRRPCPGRSSMPSADAAGRGAPSATGRSAALTVFPVVGLEEIRPGDDLAALLADLLCGPHDEESPVPAGIADGDVLVVTCLLYTSDAADEEDSVDLGGRRIIKKKNRTKKVEQLH